MREVERIDLATRHNGRNLAREISDPIPVAMETAVYAAEVRKLTNYEVWKNVESALVALAPGQFPESAEWRNLRILFEELKWRLSGLEGTGSAISRIPMTISSN